FVVAIIDDDLHEFDEFFGVEFSNVTGAWPTVAPTGVNIISDEPPPPYLFTDTPAVPESAGIVNILVSRYGDLNGSTTVDYATADGTAVAGDDYVSTNGTLTFGPGEATKSITVTLISDNMQEGRERFNVTFTNVTDGRPDSFEATVIITDPVPVAVD